MNVLSSIISILAVISFCYLSTFSKTKIEYTGLVLMALSVILGIIMRLILLNRIEWVAGLMGMVGYVLFLNRFLRRNVKKHLSMIQYFAMIVLLLAIVSDTLILFLNR